MDVLGDIKEELHKMEAPRDGFCTEMTSNLDKAAIDVGKATERIKSIVEEQCSDISVITSSTKSQIENFAQVSDSHCKDVNIQEESMLSSSDKFETQTYKVTKTKSWI